MIYSLFSILLVSGLASATLLDGRRVNELNRQAFEEAQKRDGTATRAFSNVQIKDANGHCLSVDKLSGDSRANLTPVQLVECGSTDGEGWDIITSGIHNNRAGQMLVVSTLTQACLNFDPRRAAGNQVLLFSCGGRADGGGEVTDSQLFALDGGVGPLALTPANGNGQCLTSKGSTLDVAACSKGQIGQGFTIGRAPSSGNGGGVSGTQSLVQPPITTQTTAKQEPGQATPPAHGPARIRTRRSRKSKKIRKPCRTSAAETPNVTPASLKEPKDASSTTTTPAAATLNSTPVSQTISRGAASTTKTSAAATLNSTPASQITFKDAALTTTSSAQGTVTKSVSAPLSSGNVTQAVPVSRAGGVLNPSAVAEAHQFDSTARRIIESVNIRAPDGRCFSVDPTAGDFRENLIPIGLKKCSEEPNQKFDLVTKGKHNDGKAGRALLVNVLTNGCISFDNRRPEGDKVTMFSCGGRAAGDGETDNAQLYPFKESDIPRSPAFTMNIVLEPLSGNGKSCLIAGKDRVEAAACNKGASQTFQIVEVL